MWDAGNDPFLADRSAGNAKNLSTEAESLREMIRSRDEVLAICDEADRRTREEFLFQFAGLSVNVLCNALLIPRLGLLGAALATFLGYSAILPLIARRTSLGVGLPFFGHLASFALLALVAMPLHHVLPPTGAVAILLGAASSYLAYLVALLVFKRSFLLDLGRGFMDRRSQAP